ncbi:MAG: hypothetical protein HETSPECPRED_001242 [Heterodermia speciosa]|uniref:Uncharacterized protein n=1 Tax=Heterodermia speciosa TaxID=116794 RepID=A0A8H3EWX2_9LECA|nr:MAG: hypothetical protein HETSPECPRED_001242 [Heterodermia speciosa]
MESTGESSARKRNEQADFKNRLLTYLENSPPFEMDASQKSMEALCQVLKDAAQKWLQCHYAAQAELGTLACLPLEIRAQIWDHLLRYQLAQHCYTRCTGPRLKSRRPLFISDGGWSYDSQARESLHHKIIEIRQDNHFSWPWRFTIRAVSPTIRDECDRILFSTRILRFECPGAMASFFSQIWPDQLKRLFNIRVNVFADCDCGSPHGGEHPKGWLAVFSSLPPSLRTMVVETGKKREFMVVAPGRRMSISGPIGQIEPAQSMSLTKRLALLAMLISRACTCVPGLDVSMGTWHWEYLYPGQKDRFESLFQLP